MCIWGLLKDNILLIGASIVSLAAFFLFYREWKRVGVIGFTDLPIGVSIKLKI